MNETSAFRKRFRFATLILATSSLLWVPCILLSLTFFFHDAHYELAVHAPGSLKSLSAEQRDAAALIRPGENFRCFTPNHQFIEVKKYDARDIVFVSILASESAIYRRLVKAYDTPYLDLIQWVAELDLALLSRGRDIEVRYSEGSRPFEFLNLEKIRPYCEQQDLRRVSDEPLLPPLEISAEVRSMLLRAAHRMDEAVAAYEEVRPWLSAFFYVWIAYSVLGLLCAVYVVRVRRPYVKAVRAAREAEEIPPW